MSEQVAEEEKLEAPLAGAEGSEQEDEAPQANSMAAFSNMMEELAEAISLLTIKENASGRNKFRAKWPDIAEYIYGEQLIIYDEEGVKDREHRAQLEDEATDRRYKLKLLMDEIVNKSVDKGALIFDYVGQVIDDYGVDVSQYLYAEDVIERVRPGLLETRKNKVETPAENNTAPKAAAPTQGETQPATTQAELPAEEQQLSEEEKSILSNAEEDSFDEVKPIETPAPPGAEMPADQPIAPDMGAMAEAASEAPAAPEANPAPEISEVAPLPEAEASNPAPEINEAPAANPAPEINEAPAVPPLPEAPPVDAMDEVKPIDLSAPPPEAAPVTPDALQEQEAPKAPPIPEQVQQPAPEAPASNPAPEINEAPAVPPLPEAPQVEQKIEEAPVAPPEAPASNPAPDVNQAPPPIFGAQTEEPKKEEGAKPAAPAIFGAPRQPKPEEPEKKAVEKGIYKILFNTAAKG